MKENLAVLVMAAAMALVGAFHINDLLILDGDNGHYILLAQSMLRGSGYSDILYPGSPAHSQYPPVFPLLLLPVVWAAGVHVVLLKVVPLACGVLGLFAIDSLLRRISRPTALPVVLFVCMSSFYLETSTQVMSEAPYVLFSVAAIVCLHDTFQLDRPTTPRMLCAAVLLLATCFTRSIGVTLLGAVLCHVVLERCSRRRLIQLAVVTGPALVCCAAWSLQDSPYAEQFFWVDPSRDGSSQGLTEVVRQAFFDRLPIYAQDLVPSLFVHREILKSIGLRADTIRLLLQLLALVAGLGFLMRALRKRTLVEYYVVIYSIAAVVWPWLLMRLFVPLLPFLLFYFAVGTSTLVLAASRVLQRLQTSPILSTLGLMLATAATIPAVARESQDPVFFGRWSWIGFAIAIVPPLCAMAVVIMRCFPDLRVGLTQAPQAFVLVLVAPMAVFNLAHSLTPPVAVQYSEGESDYYEAALFLRDSTPPDSVIMCRKPRMTYIWAGRQVVRVPRRAMEPSEVFHFMIDNDVDYAMVGEVATGPVFDWPYIVPILESDDVSELIYARGSARVYRIIKPLAAPPALVLEGLPSPGEFEDER